MPAMVVAPVLCVMRRDGTSHWEGVIKPAHRKPQTAIGICVATTMAPVARMLPASVAYSNSPIGVPSESGVGRPSSVW